MKKLSVLNNTQEKYMVNLQLHISQNRELGSLISF